ncbi:MAG: hypothetical protein ACFFEK_16200 [Candidatus Thorarchaeota archaeon]
MSKEPNHLAQTANPRLVIICGSLVAIIGFFIDTIPVLFGSSKTLVLNMFYLLILGVLIAAGGGALQLIQIYLGRVEPNFIKDESDAIDDHIRSIENESYLLKKRANRLKKKKKELVKGKLGAYLDIGADIILNYHAMEVEWLILGNTDKEPEWKTQVSTDNVSPKFNRITFPRDGFQENSVLSSFEVNEKVRIIPMHTMTDRDGSKVFNLPISIYNLLKDGQKTVVLMKPEAFKLDVPSQGALSAANWLIMLRSKLRIDEINEILTDKTVGLILSRSLAVICFLYGEIWQRDMYGK